MTDQLRHRIAQLEQQIRAAGMVPVTRDRPDDNEFKQLWALVATKYPALQATSDRFDRDGEHIEQFKLTIRYLSYVRRAPAPDTRYYVSAWIDAAEASLRQQGYSASIRTHVFTAAAIVSGVPYAPLDRYPHDLAFGLTLGDAATPSTTWRETLRLRQIPPPMKVAQPTTPTQWHDIAIYGGGSMVGRHSW